MNDRPTMPETMSPPDGVDLDRLFHRWPDFESLKDWRQAGFEILRDKEDKILVVSHKSADRYLFKKYGSDDYRSAKEQLEKYQSRVAGAALLRAHIANNGLRHVVVPQKWLCELPTVSGSKGKSPHVVVVERHRILAAEESEARYRRIDAEATRELCTILFAFRRLDFTARNAPFTRDGKISFIDTEYVRLSSKKLRSRKNYYQRYIDQMLSKHLRLAEDVWKELARTSGLK
jgi:hypothetical protein